MIEIRNRRYIGCKARLLNKIYGSIKEMGYDSKYSFADIFAGTGVVGYYFATKGYKVLLNDMLKSNTVAYKAWLGDGKFDSRKVEKLIENFNQIDGKQLKSNYFSKTYGGKYFSINDAKKIGYIRDLIEDYKSDLTSKEYAILLTSLMYAVDKIANTVGHFESYLHKKPTDKDVLLDMLNIDKKLKANEVLEMDANELVRNINYDIVYIDPPYNARQYVNFYHVLENLIRWNKPTEFEGNSMKFKRDELKSNYCRANKATDLFKDLIEHINAKLIVVSYNNTYVANSSSSINTITEENLKKILESKGKTTIKEINYKFFNAGKTNFKNHKEFLFICEVGK